MENKKTAIVGIGNCGSQVAWLAEKKYGSLFDCIYINTSKTDLSMVQSTSSLMYKVGDQDEIEGSGKNRTEMKKALKGDIDRILMDDAIGDLMLMKKYCYIVASTAGGTGSGAAPAMLKIMRSMFPDTNFILVAVLPSLAASMMEHGNTLEFLDELYQKLGPETTYMVYDNEQAQGLSVIKTLEYINEQIVEDIRVLTGVDNLPTPYESMDAADMENVITTPGRLLVARVRNDLTEKNLEDSSLDDIIVKTIKKSAHAETDRNKKIARWGVITYFTDAVNELYNSDLKGVCDFIGIPPERFNHNAVNTSGGEELNYLYLIASGLSPINDRVKKIEERVEALQSELPTGEDEYILAKGSVTYDALMARRKAGKRAQVPDEFNAIDILDEFL